MPGIYIHIPYCRQKCSYCNFYFSVSMKTSKTFVEALCEEIELTKDYLIQKKIQSLYFGGGTPSVLRSKDLERIITKIKDIYTFENGIEITLEANPDDISEEYISEIAKLGINRVSIGVQSFNDRELQLFNRSHDFATALNAIKICKANGIENLNMDLIFGIPGSDNTIWLDNLNIFLKLDIDHLSCYNLTIEKKTAIAHQIKTGKIPDIDEEINAKLFLETIEILRKNGYEHYEISNYARNGRYAVHNTNYWKAQNYLGLGPSAHSFNGESRQWNISNVRKYIDSINKGILSTEQEKLSNADKFNEYIMTGLRTMWGIEKNKIISFGNNYQETFLKSVKEFIYLKFIMFDGETYKLSDKGKLYADRIASELFL